MVRRVPRNRGRPHGAVPQPSGGRRARSGGSLRCLPPWARERRRSSRRRAARRVVGGRGGPTRGRPAHKFLELLHGTARVAPHGRAWSPTTPCHDRRVSTQDYVACGTPRRSGALLESRPEILGSVLTPRPRWSQAARRARGRPSSSRAPIASRTGTSTACRMTRPRPRATFVPRRVRTAGCDRKTLSREPGELRSAHRRALDAWGSRREQRPHPSQSRRWAHRRRSGIVRSRARPTASRPGRPGGPASGPRFISRLPAGRRRRLGRRVRCCFDRTAPISRSGRTKPSSPQAAQDAGLGSAQGRRVLPSYVGGLFLPGRASRGRTSRR